MNFATIPLFEAMNDKLGYISARQGVLAQNIANADTPNYQAKDIEAPDFKKSLANAGGGLPLAVTNSRHFAGNTSSSANFQLVKRNSTYELNPSGNNVSIEEEMSKVAENQMEYQKLLNLYRKSVELFKTAIGKPNGG